MALAGVISDLRIALVLTKERESIILLIWTDDEIETIVW